MHFPLPHVVADALHADYQRFWSSFEGSDRAVVARLEALRATYKSVMTYGGAPFVEPEDRFVYCYQYVLSHAVWVFAALHQSGAAQSIFEKPRVRVTALGGGPGSDLLGVLQYRHVTGSRARLACEVVDRCDAWARNWRSFERSVIAQGGVSREALRVDYVRQDLGSPADWDDFERFAASDVVTVSFLVSELMHQGPGPSEYLRRAFGKTRPGTLVVVNDANHPVYREAVSRAAAAAGLERAWSKEGRTSALDPKEAHDALWRYNERWGTMPKLTGKNFSHVYIKA
ncbi:MAG: hypothetical protein VKS61_02095 [Candidatus Sericytochromatia bacterium]|nr:hypothetical protein [Candidatus Sericytochromatia bacterium]